MLNLLKKDRFMKNIIKKIGYALCALTLIAGLQMSARTGGMAGGHTGGGIGGGHAGISGSMGGGRAISGGGYHEGSFRGERGEHFRGEDFDDVGPVFGFGVESPIYPVYD